VLLAGAVLLAVLLAGESSRAILASARLSCFSILCKKSDVLRINQIKGSVTPDPARYGNGIRVAAFTPNSAPRRTVQFRAVPDPM